MSDEASRIIQAIIDQPVERIDPGLVELFPQKSFDEVGYLRAFPDVVAAIARGEIKSGYIHFLQDGVREGRMPPGFRQEPRNRLIRFPPSLTAAPDDQPVTHSFEALVVSRSGGVLIIGWLDDSRSPVEYIKVIGAEWRLTLSGDALARVRRTDVEAALGTSISHPYGYFGFIFSDQQINPSGDFKIEVCLKDGRAVTVGGPARVVDDIELRNTVISYLAAANHFGNRQVSGIACADRGLGTEIVAHNRHITDGILTSPYVERFGHTGRKRAASIVVCLYGKMEYLFVQNALFSSGPGIEDYEFIYVCNSPELAEPLLREARIASRIYGIDQTVVILPGNAGFGGANNAAVRYANTDRIIILNPDVFPRDHDWAAKHTSILANLPKAQTKLFGAPLYYDDGSLMHGGMYFEVDKGPAREGDRTVEWQLIRVEHYGKGAPPDTARFLCSRQVPAVTGAFISCDRSWFEKLEGFTEDYVFGHYEDADLCLKSIQAGTPPWIHNLKMWHLEGKGSTRLPVHEGGSLINRWLFSATWGEFISKNFQGQQPQHPAFQPRAVASATTLKSTAERTDSTATKLVAPLPKDIKVQSTAVGKPTTMDAEALTPQVPAKRTRKA
jgi:GT2 family glycosyltransferase